VTAFTESELAYLREERSDGDPDLSWRRRLARLATVGPDGMPHVVPVGWSLNRDATAIEIGGTNLLRSKKFRDILQTGRAALVIDDVAPPWHPRGVEIRGRAQAIPGGRPRIVLRPQRIISWGLEEGANARVRYARDVA
jgi:pyridoxamine 5'-phosphate oxidase family protein